MHDFARVLHVKLRRYVLAPTEELKEKYKNYDLTTLGKGKKETVRDRSRSPLRCDFAIKVVPQSHSAWSFLHCLGDLGLGLEGFHWEWFSLAVFQWERFLLAVSCSFFLGMIFTEFSLASLAVLLQLRWCRFLCIWFKCVGSYSQSCFVCRHTSWSLNTRNLMTLDWWFGVFLVCCLVCCLVCLLKIKSTVLDFIFFASPARLPSISRWIWEWRPWGWGWCGAVTSARGRWSWGELREEGHRQPSDGWWTRRWDWEWGEDLVQKFATASNWYCNLTKRSSWCCQLMKVSRFARCFFPIWGNGIVHHQLQGGRGTVGRECT